MDVISLEVPTISPLVGLDPMNLPEIASRFNVSNADAVVLSACVQMPSLPAIQIAEDKLNARCSRLPQPRSTSFEKAQPTNGGASGGTLAQRCGVVTRLQTPWRGSLYPPVGLSGDPRVRRPAPPDGLRAPLQLREPDRGLR